MFQLLFIGQLMVDFKQVASVNPADDCAWLFALKFHFLTASSPIMAAEHPFSPRQML